MRITKIIDDFVEELTAALREQLTEEIREEVRAEFLRALEAKPRRPRPAKKKPRAKAALRALKKPAKKSSGRACGKCGEVTDPAHNAATCGKAKRTPAALPSGSELVKMPAKDRRAAILARNEARAAA